MPIQTFLKEVSGEGLPEIDVLESALIRNKNFSLIYMKINYC